MAENANLNNKYSNVYIYKEMTPLMLKLSNTKEKRVFLTIFDSTISLEKAALKACLKFNHIQVSQFSQNFDEKKRQKITKFFKQILFFDEKFEKVDALLHDIFG